MAAISPDASLPANVLAGCSACAQTWDTQQLGREWPLPSSLMVVTSPIGTELCPGQRQPPRHWDLPPPSTASCQGKEQTPGARGCPSASKRSNLDDGKLYFKDDYYLNTKHFPPCVSMKALMLLLSDLVFCLISGERSSRAHESMVLGEAHYDSVSGQHHTSLVASDSDVCPDTQSRHQIFKAAFASKELPRKQGNNIYVGLGK